MIGLNLLEYINSFGVDGAWFYISMLTLSLVFSSWLIGNSNKYKKSVLLILRDRRFNEELEQYKNSPYLSPLTAYFIKSLKRMYIYSENHSLDKKFKKKVAYYIKASIYTNQKPTRVGPRKAKKFILVIGLRIWISATINLILPVGILSIGLLVESNHLFSGWSFILVPIILACLIRGSLLVQALIQYHPKYIELVMKKNNEKSHITWKNVKQNVIGKKVFGVRG